ncbi:MAG TPA: adenosine-specific kinase, partial [Syntrophorhabdaceae bacterium]|nr:adenosine-specific kinase [Syntrophorhabdaceae bacterium]
GPCLVRYEGNDEELMKLASETSYSLSCGHTFVIFLKDGFPINVLNALKSCQEVCHIICATANPLQVIVVESEQGNGIIGVIDGSRPKGIEQEQDKKARKELLRNFKYKL